MSLYRVSCETALTYAPAPGFPAGRGGGGNEGPTFDARSVRGCCGRWPWPRFIRLQSGFRVARRRARGSGLVAPPGRRYAARWLEPAGQFP
jgi:hypothetical protein